MATKPTQRQADTQLTEQYLQNRSWDPTFDVSVTEMLGYDGTNLVRLKVDANGNIQTDDATTYKQIEAANDNVTTINYTDATKVDVSTIVQSSATVGATATETFDNSGATTLVITRDVV